MCGFETYRVPDFMWAVFKMRGASKDEVREKTWLQITNEWIVQTNYELLSPCYITVCYANENDIKEDWGEIRVAIREKGIKL